MAVRKNFSELYLKVLIPLTFKNTDIVLILGKKCFFVSQTLSIKVIPQLISRYTKLLELPAAGKIAGSKMINIVV